MKIHAFGVFIGIILLILLATQGCQRRATAIQGKSLSFLKVDSLRCEYRVDPLGVDVLQPRLSWILESDQRGVMQGAYQILVASTQKNLKKDTGDLWDSGKVEKDRMNQIVYAGDTLTSGQACFWKARVWDGQGRPSQWSEAATWSMGLLGDNDFRAKWVGLDTSRNRTGPDQDLTLDGAQWIWLAEGNPAQSAPVGSRTFRKTFTIDNTRKVTRARAALSVDNSFVCCVNGKEAGRGNNFKQPVPFAVTEHLTPGDNVLTVQAFNKAYVAEDGRIKGNTQTVYVLALTFDLLSQKHRALAEQYLVEDIQDKGWVLSTGFIGTKDLMMTLYRIGRLDVAYRLFHNDTFPSWGFSIKHGATSIWERWDGWTPEKGFQTPGMNSFAHYSFGAVNEWMVKTIGGIDFMNPGYKKLWIRPRPGGNITRAKVNYDSIRGRVSSEWTLENGVFTFKATVPPNTVGLICVPATDSSAVSEAGNFDGARFLRMEDGAAVYRVEGGTFEFTSTGVKVIEMVQ